MGILQSLLRNVSVNGDLTVGDTTQYINIFILTGAESLAELNNFKSPTNFSEDNLSLRLDSTALSEKEAWIIQNPIVSLDYESIKCRDIFHLIELCENNFILAASLYSSLALQYGEGNPVEETKDFLRSYSVSYSLNINLLACCFSHHIELMSISEKITTKKLTHPDVKKICFSPMGNLLASAGGAMEGTIRLWDVKNQTQKTSFYHDSTVNALTFTNNGNILVSGSDDKILTLWNIEKKRRLRNISIASAACSIIPTDDDEFLFIGCVDGSVEHLRTNGSKIHRFKCHENPVECIAIDNNKKMLFSAGNQTIKIWRIPDFECLETLAIDYTASSLMIDTEQRSLLSSSTDGIIQKWYY
jgi:WD40 repeat protein